MAKWDLSRIFDSPQGQIRWDEFGTGPPIVLLHGTPNWSFIWRNVVGLLAAHHRVYVFDWPGFGRSARFAGQNISWDEQARRLPELFTHWDITAPTVVAFDFAPIFALRAHFFEGLDVGAFVFADAAVIPPFVSDFSRVVSSPSSSSPRSTCKTYSAGRRCRPRWRSCPAGCSSQSGHRA